MGKSFKEFRYAHLPYCLQRVEAHRYVVLNRAYKPLGTTAPDWVDYTLHAQEVEGLTPALAQALSHDGSQDLDSIFLYRDATKPTRSAACWDAYQQRLALLARLRMR